MAQIILLRHLKSQWNADNRFAGWVDNPVSKEGTEQAKDIAFKLSKINFDIIYTSSLIRNKQTVIKVLENLEGKYPIFFHPEGKMKDWGNFQGEGNYILAKVTDTLNERYYGDLQGLNKEETKQKYGEDKVQIWRRSYKIPPPNGESLEDVYNRAIPFFKDNIEKDLLSGKDVLVVASHNTLRAIVKYIENISDDGIADVELPFGAIIKYNFENNTYKKTL